VAREFEGNPSGSKELQKDSINPQEGAEKFSVRVRGALTPHAPNLDPGLELLGIGFFLR